MDGESDSIFSIENEFHIHEGYIAFGRPPSNTFDSPDLGGPWHSDYRTALQLFVNAWIRESTLYFVHKSYFMHALDKFQQVLCHVNTPFRFKRLSFDRTYARDLFCAQRSWVVWIRWSTVFFSCVGIPIATMSSSYYSDLYCLGQVELGALVIESPGCSLARGIACFRNCYYTL
jgi:hypothetical protein